MRASAMLRAVKGQRVRREKEPELRQRVAKSVDGESEDSAENSISIPTRSCRIITQGKEDGGDTTTRGKEKAVWWRVEDGRVDLCDGGVKRREDYWATGGKRI
jgi:hypothetical protein